MRRVNAGLAAVLTSLALLGYCTLIFANPKVDRWAPQVIRAGHFTWGLSAPTALFLAQINQESGGNPTVCSKYACGLTQFTPATAKWISDVYGAELGQGDVFNSTWAIRALVRYDKHIYDRMQGATPCDRFKFTLGGYNGGSGWTYRDKKLAAANGKNPLIYDEVAPYNAGRAPQFFRENRDYPIKIIYKHQPKFVRFGGSVCL